MDSYDDYETTTWPVGVFSKPELAIAHATSQTKGVRSWDPEIIARWVETIAVDDPSYVGYEVWRK